MVKTLPAQTSRVGGTIDAASHVAIKGSISPRLAAARDEGRVSGNLKMQGLNLVLTPSAAQQADLKQLLIDQQTKNSSSYHQWLTPAQFAARFGVNDADVAKISAWLTAQGFTVSGVNNSHTRISFSGTAAQVESAFSTELHHYSMNGETHLANATAIQVPAALVGIAGGVEHVSDFRLKPRVRMLNGNAKPRYTSSQTGDHFMTPADLTTIYDIQPLYTAGIDGTGQRIAIVGQSEVLLSDIASFRTAAGLAAKAPIPVLVPGSGDAAISSGDESESDLDLEYSGAVATNADIYFVYVGDDGNFGVFDSIEYAVDTDLAPIISTSYGSCEASLGSANFTTLEAVFAQAASQGQTVFSASGDSGATDCDDSSTTAITSATMGLAVDYPASSQYVTGVGGTMFNETTGSFWNTTNSTTGGSAISYIPEEAWNETASTEAKGQLTGGGGGASTFYTAKPIWQTGTGVPNDSKRDVPDIALDAAVFHDGYLYCSSDTETGVAGSCASGFRATNGEDLTVAGGTSFAAPTAAAMLALVNQKTNSTGQGNLNPALYALAASTPKAFHDITVGDNKQPCTIGSTGCTSSPIGFSAGTGYDQATGLGSIDAAVFAGAFPISTGTGSALLPTTLTLSPANASVIAGAGENITATVTDPSGAGTPTGTVQFAIDGTNVGVGLSLSSGVATFSSLTPSTTGNGTHVITATYSGSPTYATSYNVDSLTTGVPFSLAANSTSATAPGATATTSVIVTPSNGYSGTVNFTLASNSSVLNADGCYDISSLAVTAGQPATTTLTLITQASSCTTSSVTTGTGNRRFTSTGATSNVASHQNQDGTGFPTGYAIAAAGVLCFCFRRKSVYASFLGCALVMGSLAMGVTGCGSSTSSSTSTSTSTSTTQVPAGTYQLTLTGTDSVTSTLVSSTTLTFVVQ